MGLVVAPDNQAGLGDVRGPTLSTGDINLADHNLPKTDHFLNPSGSTPVSGTQLTIAGITIGTVKDGMLFCNFDQKSQAEIMQAVEAKLAMNAKAEDKVKTAEVIEYLERLFTNVRQLVPGGGQSLTNIAPLNGSRVDAKQLQTILNEYDSLSRSGMGLDTFYAQVKAAGDKCMTINSSGKLGPLGVVQLCMNPMTNETTAKLQQNGKLLNYTLSYDPKTRVTTLEGASIGTDKGPAELSFVPSGAAASAPSGKLVDWKTMNVCMTLRDGASFVKYTYNPETEGFQAAATVSGKAATLEVLKTGGTITVNGRAFTPPEEKTGAQVKLNVTDGALSGSFINVADTLKLNKLDATLNMTAGTTNVAGTWEDGDFKTAALQAGALSGEVTPKTGSFKTSLTGETSNLSVSRENVRADDGQLTSAKTEISASAEFASSKFLKEINFAYAKDETMKGALSETTIVQGTTMVNGQMYRVVMKNIDATASPDEAMDRRYEMKIYSADEDTATAKPLFKMIIDNGKLSSVSMYTSNPGYSLAAGVNKKVDVMPDPKSAITPGSMKFGPDNMPSQDINLTTLGRIESVGDAISAALKAHGRGLVGSDSYQETQKGYFLSFIKNKSSEGLSLKEISVLTDLEGKIVGGEMTIEGRRAKLSVLTAGGQEQLVLKFGGATLFYDEKQDAFIGSHKVNVRGGTLEGSMGIWKEAGKQSWNVMFTDDGQKVALSLGRDTKGDLKWMAAARNGNTQLEFRAGQGEKPEWGFSTNIKY